MYNPRSCINISSATRRKRLTVCRFRGSVAETTRNYRECVFVSVQRRITTTEKKLNSENNEEEEEEEQTKNECEYSGEHGVHFTRRTENEIKTHGKK